MNFGSVPTEDMAAALKGALLSPPRATPRGNGPNAIPHSGQRSKRSLEEQPARGAGLHVWALPGTQSVARGWANQGPSARPPTALREPTMAYGRSAPILDSCASGGAAHIKCHRHISTANLHPRIAGTGRSQRSASIRLSRRHPFRPIVWRRERRKTTFWPTGTVPFSPRNGAFRIPGPLPLQKPGQSSGNGSRKATWKSPHRPGAGGESGAISALPTSLRCG
jgi:hypothetical protein